MDEFDENKISHFYGTSPFTVEYYVYNDNEDRTRNFDKKSFEKYKLPFKENTNKSCFAQLPTMLTDFSIKHKKWPNRVLFLCDFTKHTVAECHTTLDERYWWVSACKHHNLLPEYIDDSFAETGSLVLKLETLDIKTLYIYLIIARHLQEEPYFVSGIKYLVEERGIDFYVAFAVASRCCIGGKAHHVIPVGKQYPFSHAHNSINSIKYYNINPMLSLVKFMAGEIRNKETIIKDQKIGVMPRAFCLHDTLCRIKVDRASIKLEDLESSKVIEEKPLVGNEFNNTSLFTR